MGCMGPILNQGEGVCKAYSSKNAMQEIAKEWKNVFLKVLCKQGNA